MNKNITTKHLASLTIPLLSSYHGKCTRLANEHGLTESEFKCLRLFGSDKRLSNKQISKRMNLSASRLTRIVDGLVEKGYMIRGYDRKDWRSLNIKLSRKGKLFINKINKHFVEIHFKILKNIKVARHKSLILAMENLRSASEKWLLKRK